MDLFYTSVDLFYTSVDASEAANGMVMIDSDLPVVTYDKTEDKQYLVRLEHLHIQR